ncbi:hypothetical protein [Undibacterium sp. TC9W]|uniref:hypothetical protein n=1 Tax=Undibacterium sp. TC9W TaxID=3413053 RepID=UPI003BF03918
MHLQRQHNLVGACTPLCYPPLIKACDKAQAGLPDAGKNRSWQQRMDETISIEVG